MDAGLVALRNRISDINREQEVTVRIERLQQELASAQAEQQALTLARRELENVQEENREGHGDEDLPEPMWSDYVGLYLCVDCAAEVAFGFCFACGKVYAEQEDADDDLAGFDRDMISDSRYPEPRGTTPPRRGHIAGRRPPGWFSGSRNAYSELLHRGATQDMVERYRMEWNPASGIRAYPTGQLFDDWAGPAIMRHGGSVWYVQLGREINLDPDDADGSSWFADLLDEVFDASSLTSGNWTTVEERTDVWVTRPKTEDELDSDDSDSDADTNSSAAGEDVENDNASTEEDILRDDEYEDDSDSEVESGAQDMLYFQEDPDSDADESWDEDGPERLDAGAGGMDIDTDSDRPGSDWDSDEELSGDDVVMRRS